MPAGLHARQVSQFDPGTAPITNMCMDMNMHATTLPELGMLNDNQNEVETTLTGNHQTFNYFQPQPQPQIWPYPQQLQSISTTSPSIPGPLPAIFNFTQLVGHETLGPISEIELSVEEQRAMARKARLKMLRERSKVKKAKLRLEAQARALAEAEAYIQAQTQGQRPGYIHPSRIRNLAARPMPVQTKDRDRRRIVKKSRTIKMTGPRRTGNMSVWQAFGSASVSASAAPPIPHQPPPSKSTSNPNLIPLPKKSDSLHAPHPSSHFTNDATSPLASARLAHQTPTRAPPGPPRETCFFYYHFGMCRRGTECERAHEVHFTWPIPPPPGYVHRQACRLLLCPLREGMKEVLKNAKRLERQRERQDEKVEIERAVEDEGLELRLELGGKEEGEGDGCLDGEGDVAMDVETDEVAGGFEGSGVEFSDVEDDGFMDFEPSPSPSISSPSASPSASPQPPSSRVATTSPSLIFSHPDSSPSSLGYEEAAASDGEEDKHLTSISHAGTYHTHSKGNVRRNSKAGRAPSSLPKQIPSSSLGGLTNSLLARPTKLSGNLPGIPPKPTSAQAPSALEALLEVKTPRRSKILTEPEALVDRKVCFFWYHEGWCKPRDRIRCNYLHTLDTSMQEVSCPDPNKRHPGCNLPLCPIRLARLSEQIYIPEKTVDAGMVRFGYKLPEGEDRAEWDTNILRQAFGET